MPCSSAAAPPLDGAERVVVVAADGERRRRHQGASGVESVQGDQRARRPPRDVLRQHPLACRSGCARPAWAWSRSTCRARPPPIQPPPHRSRRRGARAAARRRTSISRRFYSNDGALADSDNNLIPDRVDVVAQRRGRGRRKASSISARGWGSSRPASRFRSRRARRRSPRPTASRSWCSSARRIRSSISWCEDKKWEAPPLQPGEGLIQLVKKAFGEKSALIVTGGDAAGVARAVQQLAETVSAHLAARQGSHDARRCRGRRAEVRRRPLAGRAGRDGPVQAADSSAMQLKGQAAGERRASRVRRESGRRPCRRRQARSRVALQGAVAERRRPEPRRPEGAARSSPTTSRFRRRWTSSGRSCARGSFPVLKKRPAVSVQARLSEPPEVRRQIEQQARAELVKAGADEKATTRHGPLRLQAGLQLALRRRPARARRQGGRPHHDQVRGDRAAAGVEAAGDVRADALAARAVSDRRDSRAAS